MLTAERETFSLQEGDILPREHLEFDINFIAENRRRLFGEWAQVAWDRSNCFERIGLFKEAAKDIIAAKELFELQRKKDPRATRHAEYYNCIFENAGLRLYNLGFHLRTVGARTELKSVLWYIKKREAMRRRKGISKPHLNEIRAILGFPTIETKVPVFPLPNTPLEQAA